MPSQIDAIRATLQNAIAPYGQQHLLQFWSQLNEVQKTSLARQIEQIDWDEVAALIRGQCHDDHWDALAARATAPPAVTAEDFNNATTYPKAFEMGGELIEAGKVAFILTAGGQGSRLGFEHPKGMFSIGPVSGRSLFQILIEHAQARGQQFGSSIPIYIMTSPQTDDETRQFLHRHQRFGYSEADLQIFCQGSMPAVDKDTGRALLSSIHEISTSPDGHGGMLKGLDRSGCLDDMRSRGIETIFYGQIDNPLLQVCNPALIGFHRLHQSEMTTQVIRKQSPLQKVGNVVAIDGQVRIIEYSDLPEHFAQGRNRDGSLKLWAGSIAVHVFQREFLDRSRSNAQALPFHRAFKKVSHVDATGNLIAPDHNNAIKFERFVFDLLPWATNALVCEVDASEGFAALKNAPPAETETAEWVRQAICRLHRRWIEEAGGQIGENVPVEISPFFAVDLQQLKQRLPTPLRLNDPTYLTSTP